MPFTQPGKEVIRREKGENGCLVGCHIAEHGFGQPNLQSVIVYHHQRLGVCGGRIADNRDLSRSSGQSKRFRCHWLSCFPFRRFISSCRFPLSG
ncbi:MAG: hypothetical protein ACLS29_08265 [Prevotellamassilia sp.]